MPAIPWHMSWIWYYVQIEVSQRLDGHCNVIFSNNTAPVVPGGFSKEDGAGEAEVFSATAQWAFR